MKCILPLLAAGLAFGQAPQSAPSNAADPVVMTVGDQKITKSQFEQLLSTLSDQQRAQLQTPAAKKKLAENYAELTMLVQEARARRLDQSEVVKTRIAIQTDQVLAQSLMEELAKPTDGDELAYYNSHKSEFDEVKARHILIRFKGSSVPLKKDEKDLTEEEALAKAQEIRTKILGGADFAEMAKENSDDAGNATHGGELGAFTRGRMVPEFEKAAFDAEVGKITEPVKTKFGYHLILVDSHEAKPFGEVRTQIEQRLRQQLSQKALADLKSKSAVTFNDAYFGTTPPKPTLLPPAPPPKENK